MLDLLSICILLFKHTHTHTHIPSFCRCHTLVKGNWWALFFCHLEEEPGSSVIASPIIKLRGLWLYSDWKNLLSKYWKSKKRKSLDLLFPLNKVISSKNQVSAWGHQNIILLEGSSPCKQPLLYLNCTFPLQWDVTLFLIWNSITQIWK